METYKNVSHCKNAKILDIAFIDSQFNKAPLLWMFCIKNLYSKTEKIYHKTSIISMSQMTFTIIYFYKVVRSLYVKSISGF